MTLRRILLLALLVAASAASAGRAQAQCASYGGGYGGWGWGYDIGRLYGVLQQNVPHFAAFPPVYYSYPVPRTYGYSPFAYPPGTMTPEVEIAEPLAIANPYFKGASPVESAEVKPKADQTTAAPAPKARLIVNPYVEQPARALATR